MCVFLHKISFCVWRITKKATAHTTSSRKQKRAPANHIGAHSAI